MIACPLFPLYARCNGLGSHASQVLEVYMPDWTRREFLAASTAAGGSLAIWGKAQLAGAMMDTPRRAQTVMPIPQEFNITLFVNGTQHRVHVDARTTLLDACAIGYI
jgi:hypothetical protein